MSLASVESVVSVVIATRDRAAMLPAAVESVLAQAAAPLEVIVVDDGSTDDTPDVTASFGTPVRYIRQDAPSGPAAARNRGLALARGAFIGFVDDDDLWAPGRLRPQLETFERSPQSEIVLGHTQRMVRRTGAAGERFEHYREPARLHHLGAGLFRRRVFERVGLFDEKLRYGEDDDWFMRAEALGVEMMFLPDVVQYYRFHGANMTLDTEARRPFLLRLLKNHLDRRPPK